MGGSGSEHTPVRDEGLVADLKCHINAHLSLKESANTLMYVRGEHLRAVKTTDIIISRAYVLVNLSLP